MLEGSEKYGRYVYTLIRVIFEFILFLAEGSSGGVKVARIRQSVRKQVPMYLLTVKPARAGKGGCL